MDTLHELDKYMKSDSKLSLDGMATTLGINFAITFGIFLMFIILRPNHSLVYAPRYKYATKTAQPPPLSHGIFSWCGPVLKANEQVLLPMIGYDALLFIRFMRMLRRLLYWMTAIGVCILIPINIVATSKTGEWPPNQGVDFLSISTINYYDGKFHSDGNLDWYWAHTVGTWLFSLLIYRALHVNYRSYVKLRRHYFESREYQRSMHSRTLLILNVPSSLQSDEALARWVSTLKLKYQPEQVCIGRRNNQLARFVEEHEAAVRKLEILLSSHLQGDQLVKGKRPMIRIGGRFFGMCGGRKVDAIEYYTERVQSLTEKINNLRSHIASNKPTNYGWMSFTHAAQAHAVAKDLDSKRALLLNTIDIDLAPQPKDIIWSNLSMNQHVRRSKRLVGSILFYGFVFLFFIPSSLLSASSNVKSMIRIFPNGDAFIKEHRTFVSLLSSYFAPVVMALFFFILPKVLRILSQQQGYLTDSSLDRQVLSKLYIFFIVNHLLVFTISSTLLGMYSQISAAVDGTKALTASAFFSTMAKNLTQVAKNICDVSTFWVNYVSLKGLGVIMDLAQVFALVSITLRKFFTRPSPRQLQEFTRPSPFDYSLFYNVLIFFFTIGLVYSVIAPLVLPFTLIYFMLATMVFRYLLMYVYVTNVETGGQIWRVLVNRLLFSTILFQIVMILVLNLKGATGPAYSMIPLPIFTAVFKLYCKRRFDPHVYYYTVDNQHLEPIIHHPPSAQQQKQQQHHHHQQNLGLRFGEPAFLSELPIPMVHERVKHLLPRLYGQSKSSKSMTKTSKGRLTRKKTVKRLSVIKIKGDQELQFQSVAENELDLDESTEGVKGLYKFDDDDASSSVVEATTTISTSPASLQTSSPLLPPSSHPPSSKKGVTDKYAPTRPLISQEDEEDEEMDLEWYARGRRLEDSTNVIEMAHLYHDRQLERGPGDVYRSRGYK